jgi:hypothetical protein
MRVVASVRSGFGIDAPGCISGRAAGATLTCDRESGKGGIPQSPARPQRRKQFASDIMFAQAVPGIAAMRPDGAARVW